MKKRILLFTLAAGLGTLVFSSYSDGPAHNGIGHLDGTGAEAAGTGSFANPNGCSFGSCHATTASTPIVVAIELYSAGTPTTHYRPGKVYTVKITGTNGANSNSRYGFQLTALKGTASSTTNVSAGTFSAPPSGVQITAPTSGTQLTVVEHSSTQMATGTTFTQTITWTAPASNVGSVSFWGAVNFVNGDGSASGADLWNTNHITIAVWPSTLGINEAVDNISISAFPNPASSQFNLQLANALPGTYHLTVVNLNGSTITSQTIEVNSASNNTVINTSNWTPGLYDVIVENQGSRKTLTVVKQ